MLQKDEALKYSQEDLACREKAAIVATPERREIEPEDLFITALFGARSGPSPVFEYDADEMELKDSVSSMRKASG